MTGWRIGYIIANKATHRQHNEAKPNHHQQRSRIHPRSRPKRTGNAKATIHKNKRRIRGTRKIGKQNLTKAGLLFTKPEAPFYVFPKREGLNSEKFTLDLLDKGVAVAPGTSFGDYREHFRISLTAPRDEIKVGLDKISEALG